MVRHTRHLGVWTAVSGDMKTYYTIKNKKKKWEDRFNPTTWRVCLQGTERGNTGQRTGGEPDTCWLGSDKNRREGESLAD